MAASKRDTTLPDATYCDGVATSDPAACIGGGGFWVNKGFEWWDDSVAKPFVSNVAVTASDTVTITLSADPAGHANQRLRHAFTGSGQWATSSGTLSGTNATAPHGNIRDTDPAVGYSSGEHLYDWLATFDDPMGFNWAPPRRALFPLPSPRRIP